MRERPLHVNISDRAHGSQGTELLQKVDQMVTNNGHCETEEHLSEEQKEMARTIRRKAEQRRTDAQKQLPKAAGMFCLTLRNNVSLIYMTLMLNISTCLRAISSSDHSLTVCMGCQ